MPCRCVNEPDERDRAASGRGARYLPSVGAAVPGEIPVTAQGLLQIALFLGVLILLVKPFGAYMAAVYEGRRTFLSPVLGPLERFTYRVSGVDEQHETDWKRYAIGLLLFNILGFVVVYGLQRLQ